MSRNHSPLWPNRAIKPSYGAVEIDWGHPLTRGLCVYFPFHERAGVPHDLAQRGFPGGYVGTPLWNAGGLQTEYDASYPTFVDTRTALAATTIVLWGLKSAGTPYLFFGVTGMPQITAAGSNTKCNVQVGGATTLQANYTVPSWSIPRDVVVTHDGGTDYATSVTEYIDGVLQTPTSGVNGNSLYSPDGNNVCLISKQLPTASAHAIAGVAFYSARVLTADEAQWLHAEPYCFLRPVIRRRYLVLAGSTPGTFKPYWAYRRSRTIGTGVI